MRAEPRPSPLRRRLVAVAIIALAGAAGLGLWQAVDTPPPSAEQQAASLAAELRCPTCQGLSVADSPSAIAVSMREIITEQLAEGRTPEEVRSYFTARYGEWILLSPTTGGLGWLVWILPAVAVLGGAGAALTQTRKRPAVVSPADLAHAAKLVELYGDGRLALPHTPAGERLEAALEFATAITDDDTTSDDDTITEDGRVANRSAMIRIAVAVAAQRRAATTPPPAAAGTDPTPAAADAEPALGETGRRRGLAWAGGTAGFAVVLLGLLAINLAPRGAGELPTGNLPEVDAGPGVTAELDTLRAAVDLDPADIPARLALAGRLIENGDAAEARVQAQTVLDQQTDHPDGLLLLGLAMVAGSSPGASQALQRFLDTAPDEHPGIPLARSLLEP
ncbi:cytochrome c-type biogenesis protein CcmH [Euzebya pacifica]|uniref:cytochrome c-type biogenesis protein CcmH n=1 Tax=Euzebya pacifica TaxID=1608957 RepID=UPI0030F62471